MHPKKVSVSEKQKLMWIMNFTKNFKWQLVVAALGFSLLLTLKVGAQEIVNTDFSMPSTSVSGNFNTTAPVAENIPAEVTPQSVYTPVNAIAIRVNNDLQQLNAPNLPRESGVFAALAIVVIFCAVVKKISDNRRDVGRSNRNASPVRAKMLPSQKPQPIHS